jgi:Mn2+/Fe2+ NRAMP family transporter
MNARKALQLIGPGMLVAGTGVGAGDLAAAAFTGSILGLTVLWAVLVGAFMKFVLNEGLTRWQLATGTTLLEGCARHLGRPVLWAFLGYLLVWSFLVAAALMSAIGVTSHAMLPLARGSEAAQSDKILYGIAHSALAVALVQLGGYRLFDKVMRVCVAVMFVIVVVTAAAMRPPAGEILSGLLVPSVPRGGATWTVALMGGIGGTVTMLCYGYWIREEGRQGSEALSACRIDLATAYAMTAFFGLGMVMIGNSLDPMERGGATLMVNIARQLETTFGSVGPLVKWSFLVGAWAAVFTSLLGVWQSIPYLFVDLWQHITNRQGKGTQIDTRSRAYRRYLYAIAFLPIIGLVGVDFRAMMKVYAVVGALFIPMLVPVLLILNGRTQFIGKQYKNSWPTTAVLIGVLVLFALVGAMEVRDSFFAQTP